MSSRFEGGSSNFVFSAFGRARVQVSKLRALSGTVRDEGLMRNNFEFALYQGLFEIRALLVTISNSGLIRDYSELGPH